MRILFLVLFACKLLFAISPLKSIKADGNVIDIIYENNQILVGTDNGFIEVFDLNSSEIVKKIEFDKIKDFAGDLIGAKVFSVDKIPNEDIILAVLQGKSFYRELYIVRDGKIQKIVNSNQKLMIKKAKFIDKNRIFLALMSNEIMLYDIQKAKFIYRKTLSQSQFSDFALDKSKTKVASASESGIINIIDVKTGKIIKPLEHGNVDNIYKVAFRKNRVLSAGQDRRGIVYDIDNGTFDRYNASFLIYACALSSDGKLGALAINEDNDIAIFDLDKKVKIATLKGQKSTLNTILFIDENRLISGSDDKYIMIWSLK